MAEDRHGPDLPPPLNIHAQATVSKLNISPGGVIAAQRARRTRPMGKSGEKLGDALYLFMFAGTAE